MTVIIILNTFCLTEKFKQASCDLVPKETEVIRDSEKYYTHTQSVTKNANTQRSTFFI